MSFRRDAVAILVIATACGLLSVLPPFSLAHGWSIDALTVLRWKLLGALPLINVITGEFKPLVASAESQRLYAHYAACARALGQAVREEFAGGSADSGFAASVGAPTICGVGPIDDS